MSLINKMLQDLDARGTPGAQSFPSQIRPVARGRAGLAGRANPRTSAAAAILALAWFGWSWHQQPRAAAKPAVASVARPAPAAIKPVQGMSSTLSVAPADAAAPAPAAAPVAAASVSTSASASAAAPV